MWFRRILILFSISAILTGSALAQQTTVKADSTHLYKDIETFSKRNKFTTFMYKLIFKPITIISKKGVKKKIYKKLVQKPYNTFQGKIIRHINIVTLDPFGNSVIDTSGSTQNFLTHAGNSLHVKTQIITIRSLLLIRQNEPFNSF